MEPRDGSFALWHSSGEKTMPQTSFPVALPSLPSLGELLQAMRVRQLTQAASPHEVHWTTIRVDAVVSVEGQDHQFLRLKFQSLADIYYCKHGPYYQFTGQTADSITIGQVELPSKSTFVLTMADDNIVRCGTPGPGGELAFPMLLFEQRKKNC